MVANRFSGLERFSALFGGDGQIALSRYITVLNSFFKSCNRWPELVCILFLGISFRVYISKFLSCLLPHNRSKNAMFYQQYFFLTRPQLNENSIQAQQQMLKKPGVLRQNSLQETGSDASGSRFSGGRRSSDTEFLKNARTDIVGEFEK